MAGIEGEWHVVPDGDSTELIELAKSVDMAIMGRRAPRADGAARLRPDDENGPTDRDRSPVRRQRRRRGSGAD